MSRLMPKLAKEFATSATQAVEFAAGVEAARAGLHTKEAQEHLPIPRLELAYELTYLRVFNAWERFLEESFLRYLCGYQALHGCETPVPGKSFQSSLAGAKTVLYGRQNYLLWHNPQKVIQRATTHFTGSRHETVIASMQGRLQCYADIRHRIAHAHAASGFDLATMTLAGRRYRGSRPGRFLRDWAPHVPTPTRWVDVIVLELRGLAFQIAPI